MKDIIPFLGKRTTREYIDKIFSRKILGAVAVGSSFMKIVEKLINMIAYSEYSGPKLRLFFLWCIAFFTSILVFVYWDEISETASETAEKVKKKSN